MNNETKPLTGAKEVGMTDDRIDNLIKEAARRLWLDDSPPCSSGNFATALTAEDRRVLAALGTPPEQVRRALETWAANPDLSDPDCSTRMQQRSSSETVVGDSGAPNHAEANMDELLECFQRCERLDTLSWREAYRKVKVIGRGGQGTVYLTECEHEHQIPKALKVYSPRPYRTAAAYHEDLKRMGDVAEIVSRIYVDNLVSIERFAAFQDVWIMIMRWIDGYDLRALLNPDLIGPLRKAVSKDRWQHLSKVVFTPQNTQLLRLTPGMAVNIIEKCLRGLAALHSRGIVHGDIKPSNIMLDRDGSIRLIDIGSAFQLSDPPKRHTWTPRYAPPEIFRGNPWTPQSDLASLGYVLIELLSGQPAITTPGIDWASTRSTNTSCDAKLLKEKERLPDRLAELLPPKEQESKRLMNLCRKLIDPDPSKRFATAEDAMDDTSGTYEFLQELAKGDLTTHFCQEVKYWIGDVHRAKA